MLFWYASRIVGIATAGRTLAGYPDPRVKTKPPTVTAFLTPQNQGQYDTFARHLFIHLGLHELDDIAKLRQFRDAIIAAFLMRYTQFKSATKTNDPVMDKVREAARCTNLEDSTLEKWGMCVAKRFYFDNTAGQTMNPSWDPQSRGIFISLTQSVRSVSDDNEKLREDNCVLKTQLATQSKLLETQTNQLKRYDMVHLSNLLCSC